MLALMKSSDRLKDIQKRLKELNAYHADAGCIDMECVEPVLVCLHELAIVIKVLETEGK